MDHTNQPTSPAGEETKKPKKLPQQSYGHDIPFDEGEKLVRRYVAYFWRTGKFYSLRSVMEEEDVIQEILLKFIRLNHFGKYNPQVTSKKYHIMRGVQTTMIDLATKKRHLMVSIDTVVDEEDQPLIDRLPDTALSVPQKAEKFSTYVREILDKLPDKQWGPVCESPLFGRCQLGVRTVFLHMAAGWGLDKIAELFEVSEGRISQIRTEVRGLVKQAILET